MVEVKRVIAPLRRLTGPDDPGHVVEGWFKIERSSVVLTDSDGHPISRGGRRPGRSDLSQRWERALPKDADPNAVARALLRERYWTTKSSDFNRPLPPPKISIV